MVKPILAGSQQKKKKEEEELKKKKVKTYVRQLTNKASECTYNVSLYRFFFISIDIMPNTLRKEKKEKKLIMMILITLKK